MRPSNPDQQRVWELTPPAYHLVAKGVKLSDLCYMLLSTEAQELVVNKTGLDGAYDFELSWRRPESNGDAPEIFDAVKQQLGLEMVRQRIPSDVLAIDGISRPDAN